MRPVLILGGYGNFGKRIAALLARSEIPVVIAGRNHSKAANLLGELPGNNNQIAIFDAEETLAEQLRLLEPSVVVNTCGPFQARDYTIAQICIDNGFSYIDLADGRDFVGGITMLDQTAKKKGISVISGASTVPGISSAVVEKFLPDFEEISCMTFGISPGQKAERGLATTQGILSYVGKPLKPFASDKPLIYGWQDLYRQPFPGLGKRWMANCDIPDLDLLPETYGIEKIRFSAGLELPALHLGLWALSWLVRLGLPLHLGKWAKPLLSTSNFFDVFGSADGGMHVELKGADKSGRDHQQSWYIIAKSSHGPYIPTVPAVILARKIALGEFATLGAMPCVGLVSLSEVLSELRDFDVETFSDR
ncbi:MAG: saccharopine dehydrogenase NADP-binding domain-containing protein [Proteobacteria bacterium]|nr:saccharopine dehydrogenase NADP-binding domain-containing protein [Pseudomonadota bacterium]